MQFHAATQRIPENGLSQEFERAWDEATSRCTSSGPDVNAVHPSRQVVGQENTAYACNEDFSSMC